MKNRQRGFTLVELLVVIAIIGLLSTIGVVSLNQARAKARDAKRLSDVRQLSSILELFYNGAQQYPQSAAAGIQMSNNTQSGAVCESGGVLAAAAATPTCPANTVTLLANIPLPPIGTGPGGANVNEYRYISYATTTPSTNDCNATGNDGVCQGYGIQFGLETSVSGVVGGLNCFTPGGVLTGACAAPTQD